MPMRNWWAARVEYPSKFIRIRMKTISKGIQIAHGPLKKPPKRATGTHVQSYRFNIGRFTNRSSVVAWLKEHKIRYMMIEAPVKVKVNEFNPNHDERGRFSSAGGGGGGGKGAAKGVAVKKKVEKAGGVITTKHEGIVSDDLIGYDIQGSPTKFNKYILSNGTVVLVDSSVKDHKAATQKFADSLAHAPVAHSTLVKTVVITDKGMAKGFGQGTDLDIYAKARYKQGKITVFNGAVNDRRISGITTHEIGHLVPPGSSGRRGFSASFKRDRKDVTLYGTRGNPEEAFAEAYAKFFITGKVTGIGGKTQMKSTTAWFNKNYQSSGTVGKSSTLLYESVRIVTLGNYTITATYDKRGRIVGEEFRRKVAKKMGKTIVEIVAEKIVEGLVNEFNPSHDERGRFSLGGGGGGGGGSRKMSAAESAKKRAAAAKPKKVTAAAFNKMSTKEKKEAWPKMSKEAKRKYTQIPDSRKSSPGATKFGGRIPGTSRRPTPHPWLVYSGT